MSNAKSHKVLDKNITRLMANTFHSVLFGLMLGALLLWQHGVFNWEKSQWFFSLPCVLILSYFVIDWLDGNIVPDIDDEITPTDVFEWVFYTTTVSVTLILIIHKDYLFALFISVLYNLFVPKRRDNLLLDRLAGVYKIANAQNRKCLFTKGL